MKLRSKKWVIYGLFTVLSAASCTVQASEAETIPFENTQPSSEEGEVPSPEIVSVADAVQVVLPTDHDHMFDFILDPERLIYQTGATAYENRRFEEDATLFFRRTDDAEMDYSGASDVITIINKGSTKVEAIVTAKMDTSSLGDITLTDDIAFTDDTDTSIFLALTDGENFIPIDEEEGAVLRISMPVDTEEAQEEKEDSCRFWLTGAANSNGNWRKLTEGAPRVIVSWKLVLEKQEEPADCSEEDEELSSVLDPDRTADEDAGEAVETEEKEIPAVEENQVPEMEEADDQAVSSDQNEVPDSEIPKESVLPDETEADTAVEADEEKESPSMDPTTGLLEKDTSAENDVNSDMDEGIAEEILSASEREMGANLSEETEAPDHDGAEIVLGQETDADDGQGDNE